MQQKLIDTIAALFTILLAQVSLPSWAPNYVKEQLLLCLCAILNLKKKDSRHFNSSNRWYVLVLLLATTTVF